ncbi:MAG: endonuclease/exonuclease/phosphatase family protein, partial [Propionibacteriaceae bacterium]|nr:endonuclease/exonuclease/phosphatase family protein [Propionibacteriaceae bacterium]
WDERFPYSVGERGVALSDAAIYSKFPLAQSASLPGSTFQQWISTADVPGIGPVRIIAAHPCNPYCGSNRWVAEHKQLRATADAAMNMPLIVVGDFNAVDDHGPIRALRGDGLDSATDIVGAGWLPTYPANRMIPPLLPIDHILVNSYLTATSISTFNVSGTDHRGVIAQIAGTG